MAQFFAYSVLDYFPLEYQVLYSSLIQLPSIILLGIVQALFCGYLFVVFFHAKSIHIWNYVQKEIIKAMNQVKKCLLWPLVMCCWPMKPFVDGIIMEIHWLGQN